MPLLQRFICTTRTVAAGPHEEGGAWPLQAAADRTDAAHQPATDRSRRRGLARTKRSGICEKTLAETDPRGQRRRIDTDDETPPVQVGAREGYEQMSNERNNGLAGEPFTDDHELHDPQMQSADAP